jgi:hypothetical protein
MAAISTTVSGGMHEGGRLGGRSGRTGERVPEEECLVYLAELLGLELPPFLGPLVVFDPAGERSTAAPSTSGGDLHAVHPDDARVEAMKARDETLTKLPATPTSAPSELLGAQVHDRIRFVNL